MRTAGPRGSRLGGRRQPHALKLDVRPPAGTTYLAQAFYKNEPLALAIPVDQIEFGPDEAPPTLYLPVGGDVIIRVVDAAGKTIASQ